MKKSVTTNQFIIKNFYKKEAVKVFYVGEDKKVRVKWVLPVNDNITIDDDSWKLSPEKIFIENGVTCVFVNSRNAEPINPLQLQSYVFSSTDYNTAISSQIGKELFEANKPKETNMLFLVALVVIVGAIGFLYFKVDGLEQTIKDFIELSQEVS